MSRYNHLVSLTCHHRRARPTHAHSYKNVPLERYPRQHRLRETLRNKVAGGGVARPPISEEAIKLLELMLALDPKKRITAADAIMVSPLACDRHRRYPHRM